MFCCATYLRSYVVCLFVLKSWHMLHIFINQMCWSKDCFNAIIVAFTILFDCVCYVPFTIVTFLAGQIVVFILLIRYTLEILTVFLLIILVFSEFRSLIFFSLYSCGAQTKACRPNPVHQAISSGVPSLFNVWPLEMKYS